MKILSKFILFSFSLFLLLIINYSLLIPSAKAEVEAFPRVGFPCNDVKDPEFHSLRPYQAAACGDANKALFCSNELKFIESFDLTSQCDLGKNTSDFWCKPKDGYIDPHNLYVELTDSMFPILGNTEQVKNYDKKNDEFSDAQKVNEYASWYLSGVNNRAEYEENTDSRVVNFSGPIQKLLPSVIQDAQRISTIASASAITNYVDEEVGDTTEPQNHNQIVVCGDSNFGWFGGLLNIGKITPVPCYGGDEKFRLIDKSIGIVGDQGWYGGDLSDFNGLFNRIGTDIWNKRTPPLPWADKNGDPFESQQAYQKAYNEWRGDSCAKIPFVDLLLCIDNPFVPNKWADLYQYIPLSNTTDKKGAERILDVQFKPSIGTTVISGEKYDEANQKNAPLYFAHTEEVKESSELLNKTYLPQGYKSEKVPETTETLPKVNGLDCSAVNVRTNKGDNLFPGDRSPGDTKEMVIPKVTYNIDQVLCKVTKTTIWVPNLPPKKGGSWETTYSHHCNAEVTIVVPTDVKVPNADEIFSTTVADSGSTFRKIFPKVEEGAPVSCIADIPTVTGVTYNAEESETPRGGSLEFGVKKIPEDGGGDKPELTFPHIGSVYEYFLKGIQTALRPKGYGEPIADGNCKPTEEPETGACKQWLLDENVYNKVIAKAASTKCNGKSLNPFWAIGIGLNENGGLMTDMADGSSSSHFGCNVSQVQSIDEKIDCMVNTLRNDCAAGKTDEATLQEYGYLPGYVLWPITVLDPGGVYPPPLFGSGFNTSQLITNLNNTDWRAAYASKAPIFCPSSPTLPY
ncbi:MAG: hypothetical protein AAB625_00370 [Patescibacteria group bacterium]